MLSWSDRDKDAKLSECGVDGCEGEAVARVVAALDHSDAYAFGAYRTQVRVLVCLHHVERCVRDRAEQAGERWLAEKYGSDWDEDIEPYLYETRWDEAFTAIGYDPEE